MIMITNLLFSFTNLYCVFLTKLLTFGILFSTAVNAELVGNPVILGILFSISVILAFKSVFFLARSHVLGIFFSASLIVFLILIYLYHI